MCITAVKGATARTLATILLGTASAAPIPARADDRPIADNDIATWVAKRVQDWQPTAADRRFDEIGWVKDIRTALRLAREHNRPVFLFTHDGHIAVGRC